MAEGPTRRTSSRRWDKVFPDVFGGGGSAGVKENIRVHLCSSASDLRARWRAVAEREAEEHRRTPVAVRWQQLNALIAFAQELGLDWRRRDEAEPTEVRRRWVKIKEHFERKY